MTERPTERLDPFSVVTGLDRAEFTTQHARRILTGPGFPAGRRRSAAGDSAVRVERGSTPLAGETVSPHDRARARPTAETLEPFIGLWLATKGPDVLVAASAPGEVVAWLAEHRQQADSMFRVPADEFQANGFAPR